MNSRLVLRLIAFTFAGSIMWMLMNQLEARASDVDSSPAPCKAWSAKISKHTFNILRQMYEGLDVEHDPRLVNPDPSNIFWQNQIRLGYVTYSCELGKAPQAASIPSPFPEDPCNRDAYVVRAAATVPSPQPKAVGASGVVLVNVSIDGAGKPSGVAIAASPSSDLDGAALDAASRSLFAPKLRDCKIVPTTLLYAVPVGR